MIKSSFWGPKWVKKTDVAAGFASFGLSASLVTLAGFSGGAQAQPAFDPSEPIDLPKGTECRHIDMAEQTLQQYLAATRKNADKVGLTTEDVERIEFATTNRLDQAREQIGCPNNYRPPPKP